MWHQNVSIHYKFQFSRFLQSKIWVPNKVNLINRKCWQLWELHLWMCIHFFIACVFISMIYDAQWIFSYFHCKILRSFYALYWSKVKATTLNWEHVLAVFGNSKRCICLLLFCCLQIFTWKTTFAKVGVE